MQWAGHLIGALLFLILAFVPTGLYTTIWWFIPKIFWTIFWTVIGGVVWLVVQTIWALCVGMWWDDLHKDIVGDLPAIEAAGDGDLDISY